MRAIRVHQFGDPEVLRLETVPEPIPGPGEVRITVRAIGVNPHDTYVRSGMLPGFELPLIPGQDGAGVVEAVGDGVSAVREGERVYFGGCRSGAYAERVVCLESQVHPLPEALEFAEGAALHVPYATAYLALFDRAGLQPGETLLVRGASGAVGLAALQLARGLSVRILGTAGSPEGRELALEQGADEVFDHHDLTAEARIREAASEGGVDVILEMLANENLDRDLDLLAARGRVVVVGNRGRIEIDPRKTMLRNASILGMGLLGYPPDQHRAVHQKLAGRLAAGDLKPVIREVLPLEQAPLAHSQVLEPGARGKIVLQP